jgi:hypothetical protein
MSNIQALGSLMCEVSVGVRDRALLEHVLLFKLRKALVDGRHIIIPSTLIQAT